MSRTAQTARMLEAATAEQDRAAIIGRASSHVAWALAAAEAFAQHHLAAGPKGVPHA